MVAFSEVYAELFNGEWSKTPADFGIEEEGLTPVCELCLWQHCDRCRIDSGEWEQFGPPPLRLVLDGSDYYDDVPPERDPPWPVQEAQRCVEPSREKRNEAWRQKDVKKFRVAIRMLKRYEHTIAQHEQRLAARQRWLDSEQEEPETVEYIAGAVVKHRCGGMQIIPTRKATLNDAAPLHRDENRPPTALDEYISRMMKTRDDDEPLQNIGHGTLTVIATGGSHNGEIFGTVQTANRRYTRTFTLDEGERPTKTTAAYKAFVNGVYVARHLLTQLPPEKRPALVRFEVNSRGVQYQLLRHTCNAPHLARLHNRAQAELAELTALLGQGRSGKTACYQIACL